MSTSSKSGAAAAQFGATNAKVARILHDLMEDDHDVATAPACAADTLGGVPAARADGPQPASASATSAAAAAVVSRARAQGDQRGVARRQSRAHSTQTRAKISATIRAKAIARGAFAWDDQNIATLRKAHAQGGNPACMAAFPNLREGQVYAAVRRYCLLPNIAADAACGPHAGPRSVWDDPSFVRRFMEALTGRTYTP